LLTDIANVTILILSQVHPQHRNKWPYLTHSQWQKWLTGETLLWKTHSVKLCAICVTESTTFISRNWSWKTETMEV